MNERQFWQRVQKLLHRPKTSATLAWKVQDAFRVGLPDALIVVNGTVWLMELKVNRKVKALDVMVTASQLAHLREWKQAGGNAGLLVYDEPEDEVWLMAIGHTMKPAMVLDRDAVSGYAIAIVPLKQMDSLIPILGAGG